MRNLGQTKFIPSRRKEKGPIASNSYYSWAQCLLIFRKLHEEAKFFFRAARLSGSRNLAIDTKRCSTLPQKLSHSSPVVSAGQKLTQEAAQVIHIILCEILPVDMKAPRSRNSGRSAEKDQKGTSAAKRTQSSMAQGAGEGIGITGS